MALAVATALAIPAVILAGRGPPGTDTAPPPPPPVPEEQAAPSERPDPPPSPVDTLLVFDDGGSGAVAVDFEEGVLTRRPLPGQRPGERPFRLWRLDQRLVVGSDRIVAVRLDSASPTELGRAAAFLPDARSDRLWLVDAPGAGAGPPTWTLVDGAGRVLHRTTGRPGMVALRGVPGGLALSTDQGLKVYDVTRGQVFFYVGAPDGAIGDVAGGRVAWCRPGCPWITIRGSDRDVTRLRADDVISFDVGSIWLSPDATHIAAVARTSAAGVGTVREVLVFEIGEGAVRARRRLPAGDLEGGWSTDSRQFYFAVELTDGPARPASTRLGRFRVQERWFEVRDHDRLGPVDAFVALPRSSVTD